jgi:hypothetical protein
MELVELVNIARKHTVLHYRRAFTATAIFDNGGEKPEEHDVRIVVEHAPLGPTNITIEHVVAADPQIDLNLCNAQIRARIVDLDASGMLP